MATAIALFGFESSAAFTTVVGVLIKVRLMIAALKMINASRGWYERREGVMPNDECCPEESPLHVGH